MATPTEDRSLLLFAIVQDQDVEPAKSGLEKIGLPVWILPSTGGFLGRRNNTLLIPCPYLLFSEVSRILQQNCRQRIEYLSMPLDNSSMTVPMAFSMPVPVGGAAIFSFEVDYQEEII